MTVLHVPERTCVGCRGRATKRDLIRVARGPTGEAELDLAGTAPGRGAYVHRMRDCVELALSRGRLQRALRVGMTAERAATLMANIVANIEEEPRA